MIIFNSNYSCNFFPCSPLSYNSFSFSHPLRPYSVDYYYSDISVEHFLTNHINYLTLNDLYICPSDIKELPAIVKEQFEQCELSIRNYFLKSTCECLDVVDMYHEIFTLVHTKTCDVRNLYVKKDDIEFAMRVCFNLYLYILRIYFNKGNPVISKDYLAYMAGVLIVCGYYKHNIDKIEQDPKNRKHYKGLLRSSAEAYAINQLSILNRKEPITYTNLYEYYVSIGQFIVNSLLAHQLVDCEIADYENVSCNCIFISKIHRDTVEPFFENYGIDYNVYEKYTEVSDIVGLCRDFFGDTKDYTKIKVLFNGKWSRITPSNKAIVNSKRSYSTLPARVSPASRRGGRLTPARVITPAEIFLYKN